MNENSELTEEELEDYSWGQPFQARKWHIFEDGMSLCDSWMYGSATQSVIPEDEADRDSDCVQCCRKAGFDV